MEVLEVMPNPDVVVVCCGGGGLLAGVAAAIKLSGCDKTRIYGVEPEGGNTSEEASNRFTSLRLSQLWVCCEFVFLLEPSLHHVQKFH